MTSIAIQIDSFRDTGQTQSRSERVNQAGAGRCSLTSKSDADSGSWPLHCSETDFAFALFRDIGLPEDEMPSANPLDESKPQKQVLQVIKAGSRI